MFASLQDGSENDRQVRDCDDAATANQKRMNADPVEMMLMNMGYRFTGFLDMDEDEGGQEGGQDAASNCRTT